MNEKKKIPLENTYIEVEKPTLKFVGITTRILF